MDKILLTAFLTALAGFITAALSIVKLVNEKESKTTEFRQSWTESARGALSDLIAKINSHAHAVANVKESRQNLFSALDFGEKAITDYEKEVHKGLMDFQYDLFHKSLEQSSNLAREVYQAHAKVRLHFKPEDPDFVRIENKFDFCMNKLSDMRREDDSSRWDVLREEIHSATNEITASSRALLKTEWEKVKLGEPAYKTTKKWSVWFCVIMFAVLITIGTHAITSYVKPPFPHSETSQGSQK
ncbi:hypothetical protein ACTACG_07570 [Pseudomonas syringae]|uniref:hypothetical protein n=1 Tax=Pseudomonas syringae TaxID=317 RepID=UPI003F7522C8